MKNKNKINLNYHWCPWCKKEKLPDKIEWQEGPALIPDTARDIICPDCFDKILSKENLRLDYKGNLKEV